MQNPHSCEGWAFKYCPCCRLGKLQQFVWRLKVKITALCVQLAAEQSTYCVLSDLLSVSVFFTIEKTFSLSALLFGRDSSGNTTAHKVANRWLPVLVLPFPMPSSCSNAKMRIAYSAKRMWQPFRWSIADRRPTLGETLRHISSSK